MTAVAHVELEPLDISDIWPVIASVAVPLRDADGRVDETGVRRSALTFYVASGSFQLDGLSGRWRVGVDGSVSVEFLAGEPGVETSRQFLLLLQDLIPVAAAAYLRLLQEAALAAREDVRRPCAELAAAKAETERLQARLDAVLDVIGEFGCDCDCGYAPDECECDEKCEPCLAHRVEAVLNPRRKGGV